jgi:hypothetical protein
MVNVIRTSVSNQKKKTGFYIYTATTSSVCNKAASNQHLHCFNNLPQLTITPISTIIHLVHLCNTSISEFLNSINYNYKGLQDTTLASLVLVMCVAMFQSNHRRSATSPCTRLSQSVRRLHNSANLCTEPTERITETLVTNPTVHAENCTSWEEHTALIPTVVGADRSRRSSRLGRRHQQWVERKTKSWSIHSVAVSARRTYNTAVSTRTIHAQTTGVLISP